MVQREEELKEAVWIHFESHATTSLRLHFVAFQINCILEFPFNPNSALLYNLEGGIL